MGRETSSRSDGFAAGSCRLVADASQKLQRGFNPGVVGRDRSNHGSRDFLGCGLRIRNQAAQSGVSKSTDKRKRTVEEPLLNTTRTWLASLPQDVRAVELARQFPRIANRLRHLWKQVARCEEYLDDLLVDRRGTRKGFPSKIGEELEALREYHALLYPRGRTTWD